jgi:hypothetical protein
LVVGRANRIGHPGVEFLIGILVAQEILDLLRVVDLLLLVGDLLLRDFDPYLLGQDLLVEAGVNIEGVGI